MRGRRYGEKGQQQMPDQGCVTRSLEQPPHLLQQLGPLSRRKRRRRGRGPIHRLVRHLSTKAEKQRSATTLEAISCDIDVRASNMCQPPHLLVRGLRSVLKGPRLLLMIGDGRPAHSGGGHLLLGLVR
jgi:hypothetical protein